MDLENLYREDHTSYNIIVCDFNTKIGPTRTPVELHIGTHGIECNEQEERPSEFIITTKTIEIRKFRSPRAGSWTWEPRNEGYLNEIDHIIISKKFCLTDIAVAPKPYTGLPSLRKIFFRIERKESHEVHEVDSSNHHRPGALSLVDF
ncbi:hypothetical protein NECAME_05819 [Necator americanus]|uniref:Uncharacterized protein n=1 Tax=Necator americanus TaxID=51031 RepID=W2U0K4_NECAM|nr:hypothetical protein NECAME_05819 [Necator americanus]ETN86827.1 hypothetical protein NECAME_05819 [Necator americanus]